MVEFIATAVVTFLGGVTVGIVGMYHADSKYIRTIRKSCKKIVSIHKRSEYKKKLENERLRESVNKLQIKLAQLTQEIDRLKSKEGINA